MYFQVVDPVPKIRIRLLKCDGSETLNLKLTNDCLLRKLHVKEYGLNPVQSLTFLNCGGWVSTVMLILL